MNQFLKADLFSVVLSAGDCSTEYQLVMNRNQLCIQIKKYRPEFNIRKTKCWSFLVSSHLMIDIHVDGGEKWR